MLKYTITQKNRARGDPTWYGRIFDTITKEVRFVSLGTPLKRLADEWLRKSISEEMSGRKDEPRTSIYKAMADYLRAYERKRVQRSYTTLFAHLKGFCGEHSVSLVTDLTPSLCSEFFVSIDGLKASTKKVMLSLSKTWWRWCSRAYGLKGLDDPFDIVRIERPEPPDRSFWTPEQLDMILDASCRNDRMLYALMCYAGLRIHEAVKLRWEDIHDGKIHVVGKGKKFATVPISRRMQAELERYGTEREGCIVEQLTHSSYATRLHRLFETHPELDFGGKVHHHRFRHSFASNLARANVGVYQLMRLMRHSSINMVQRYLHLMPDDLAEAINKS